MLSALLAHGFDIRSFPGAAPSALHVVTNAAGYEQRRNEVYNWDGLTRGTTPFLVIQHTLVGEGRLDHAGVKHRLTPGKTMLVTMPHAHRYWLERGGHWEYFWLLISGREALRMARAILEAAGPVLTPSEGAVEQMAAACLRLLSPPMPNAAEAAQAYDLGADEVFTPDMSAPELALRLSAVMARRREGRRLRGLLHDAARLAAVDDLTGLWNRRYALPHLATMAEAAQAKAETGKRGIGVHAAASVAKR